MPTPPPGRHLTSVPGAGKSAAEQGQQSLASVKAAWEILAAGAPAVAKELVRIAQESESDFVRFSAGVAVLDRVGLGKVDGHVVSVIPEPERPSLPGQGSAATIVAARLAALSGGVSPVGLSEPLSAADGQLVAGAATGAQEAAQAVLEGVLAQASEADPWDVPLDADPDDWDQLDADVFGPDDNDRD